MRMLLKMTFVVYVYAHSVLAHLCLLSPRQRGTMDISVAGSSTCFRHKPPCGGQTIEAPVISYIAGESVFFKWQQNYNHYEAGFPGYMDIAISPSVESTNFTTLAVITDNYVHAQDYQENYTAVVKIPDMLCEHCVIRARYNAHKPGETTFLQCSDIAIGASDIIKDKTLRFNNEVIQDKSKKLLSLKKALSLQKYHQKLFNVATAFSGSKLYGFAFNPFEPQQSYYISADTDSGQIETINTFDFGIDTPTGTKNIFMLNEVISIDYGHNTSNILVHTTGSRDDVATTLFTFGSVNGSMTRYSDIFNFKGGAINGLSWYTFGVSATFRILPAETDGTYYFEVGTLDIGGVYTPAAQIPKPEDLYVNFQWFETDMNNYQRVYALLGNENEADALDARIYIFDIDSRKFVQYTELDVTKYTFMSMHSYPNSESLFAFSPGLWYDEQHAWSLVAIEPLTGNVTKRCDIAPPGIFQRYYGGSVFQGSTNHMGFLHHVLRVEGSEADFVVSVNPITCEMKFSEVTNLRHIHSLQRV